MHGAVVSVLPPAVTDGFDVVSWDPRGVGKSEPFLAGCEPVQVLPPATGPVDWDAYWEEAAAVEGAANARCFAANPNKAAYLGTWQVVRDMDAMRSALGYPRWSYWGMSYGTRIGNAYARTFPEKLRALIEDAPIMANESNGTFGGTTPAGNHETVQVYASLVGKGQAYKVRATQAYLDDAAIEIDDEQVLDRWTFNGILNTFARNQGNYPQLRALIDELFDYVVTANASGGPSVRRLPQEPEPLDLDPDELVPEPDKDDFVPDPFSDAFIVKFVNCADMADRPTTADLARMSRQAEASFGTAYGLEVGRSSMCLGLPSGYSPPSPRADATQVLRTPPLFLLGTGDAATQWVWGRSLANTFAKSRTVTYDTTTHGNLGSSSECVNDAIERYLVHLELPRTDIFCPYVPTPTAPQ